MKSRTLACIIAMSVFAALAMPIRLAAQDQEEPPRYSVSNLVANRTGLGAPNIDPNLINAWGLTSCQIENHEGDALFCVADAFAGVATVYTHSGKKIPITINIPAATVPVFGEPVGLPTGIVFNTTRDFVISENGKSGPAVLIFASVEGTISGWNPNVDASNAIKMVDNSTRTIQATYEGLAIGRNSEGRNVLYAADSNFVSGSASTSGIDMFDGSFNSLGRFSDPSTGMPVYNVHNVRGRLFVTFAPFIPMTGGAVDVFDTDGNLLTHFTTNSAAGPLQGPWGVALAPDDFGPFSGALLIGNVCDGRINAYNPRTHKFLGQLTDKNGNVIAIDELWELLFDRSGDEGKSKKLFFTAGPNNYADGLFGKIVPADRDNQAKR
jgi:uncharacterized protein (TIGR03118 family)